MTVRRLRAAPTAAWITTCITVVAGLSSACGGREIARDSLIYDLWSGGAVSTGAGENTGASDDPSAPNAPSQGDQSGSPLASEGATVVAGETEVRSGDPPVLEVSVEALDFGEAETLLTFQVHNAGGGTMEYTIAASQSWMSVSPDAGTNEGAYDEISAQVDRTGLEAGPYAGSLTIATADGQQKEVTVSMGVPATPPADPPPADPPPPDDPPPPADPPPPDGPTGPGRAAYFFWDWSVDEAQIDAFVPLLVGHYTSLCIVFIADRGDVARVQANVEHVLSIPHPPELIVGLTSWGTLEDVSAWQEVGSLAAWCAARTGVPRIGIDIEFALDGYLYHDVPLDLAKYEEGLQAFAAYVPDVQIYLYPPNYEGYGDANMKTVLQRTRVISAAVKYLPNFHAMGASVSTYGAYLAHPLGEEYRSLEAFWSAPGGPVEQIFLINGWWVPDTLRPILATIPRECWLYVEPPYSAETADLLIRCLEAPPG